MPDYYGRSIPKKNLLSEDYEDLCRICELKEALDKITDCSGYGETKWQTS